MDDYSPQNHPSDDEYNLESILAQWHKAMSALHTVYTDLTRYKNKLKTSSITTVPYAGQCPAEALVSLATTIQTELKTLLTDIDRLDESNPAAYKLHCRKLIEHTRAIHELVYKAQIRLYLASGSSS
ncbi:hypothetical protein GCM10027341_42710 [Spirosoma knui]